MSVADIAEDLRRRTETSWSSQNASKHIPKLERKKSGQFFDFETHFSKSNAQMTFGPTPIEKEPLGFFWLLLPPLVWPEI